MKNVPQQSNAMEVKAVKKEPVWSVQKSLSKISKRKRHRTTEIKLSK